MNKLTDKEVDVLMAIWDSDNELVPTGEILRCTKNAKRNSLQVLQVVLRRLCEKGMINYEKGPQTNYYRALIPKDDYIKFATENFAQHHFHGSMKNVMFFFITKKILDAEDLGVFMEITENLED